MEFELLKLIDKIKSRFDYFDIVNYNDFNIFVKNIHISIFQGQFL